MSTADPGDRGEFHIRAQIFWRKTAEETLNYVYKHADENEELQLNSGRIINRWLHMRVEPLCKFVTPGLIPNLINVTLPFIIIFRTKVLNHTTWCKLT